MEMKKNKFILQAYKQIIPNAKVFLDGDKIVYKDTRPQPTKEQIQAKIKELEAQAKIDAKYDSCKNYIYQYYPQDKQASDQADKEYFSTLLKAKGVENLESIVATKVQDFFQGATLESLVANVADEDKEAYIQLVKVGIRVTWVQMCKQELRKAIAEEKEPEFPKYPL